MAVCDASMSLADYMTNFEFIKAMTCAYFSTAGMLVTGMLVYGAISTGIYIRTGSILIPTVLIFLVGGVVLSQVGGLVTAIATVMVLVAGAGVITYAYAAYSR